MLQERKRFNYLSSQQRTLNSTPSNLQTEKSFGVSRIGSIISSGTKAQQSQNIETSHGAASSYQCQQFYNNSSRKSSVSKSNAQIFNQENPITKSLTYSNAIKDHFNLINSNKQNALAQRVQFTNLNSQQTFKPSSANKTSSISIPITTVQQSETHSTNAYLQSRIQELEKQNQLLLKTTEQKFLEMESHLEKVEDILKEKEEVIQSLKNDNESMKSEKQQLFKIIGEKNKEIKSIQIEKYNLQSAIEQINAEKLYQTLQSPKSAQQIQTQTQIQLSSQSLKQSSLLASSEVQTQIVGSALEQILKLSTLNQQSSKVNYRQKYEALFKKALEMQDQMYKLKQQLFENQNEVKTIQQEFNTYKILNQIQKINTQQME